MAEQTLLSILADWGVILTPIIIGVGFYFARRQWQGQRNTRMAQLVISITNSWTSPEMSESRRKINELGVKIKQEYEAADKENRIEAYTSITQVLNFFDTLGVLVSEGFLTVKIAYDVFGKAEKIYCRLYEPLITAREFEGYVPCVLKLHDLFVKEEGRRSPIKEGRPS